MTPPTFGVQSITVTRADTKVAKWGGRGSRVLACVPQPVCQDPCLRRRRLAAHHQRHSQGNPARGLAAPYHHQRIWSDGDLFRADAAPMGHAPRSLELLNTWVCSSMHTTTVRHNLVLISSVMYSQGKRAVSDLQHSGSRETAGQEPLRHSHGVVAHGVMPSDSWPGPILVKAVSQPTGWVESLCVQGCVCVCARARTCMRKASFGRRPRA